MSLSDHPPPLVSPAALGNQLKPNSPHGIKHSAHGMQLNGNSRAVLCAGSGLLQAITCTYENESTESDIPGPDGTFSDTCLNSYPCAPTKEKQCLWKQHKGGRKTTESWESGK